MSTTTAMYYVFAGNGHLCSTLFPYRECERFEDFDAANAAFDAAVQAYTSPRRSGIGPFYTIASRIEIGDTITEPTRWDADATDEECEASMVTYASKARVYRLRANDGPGFPTGPVLVVLRQ